MEADDVLKRYTPPGFALLQEPEDFAVAADWWEERGQSFNATICRTLSQVADAPALLERVCGLSLDYTLENPFTPDYSGEWVVTERGRRILNERAKQ